MTIVGLTREDANDLMTYFNVADEVWPVPTRRGFLQLTLDDLDPVAVEVARKVGGRLGLPWPPDLAAAEDFLLLHGPQIRFLLDTTPGGTQ